MKLRPLHDRVVVRRAKEEEKTKGGIIIPDTAKEKPQEGEIVAVGNGAIGDDNERVALDVKVGDRVLFGKAAYEIGKIASFQNMNGNARKYLGRLTVKYNSRATTSP